MPWVEILFNDEASRYRRMEMAIAIDSQYMTEDNAVQMASALAGFAHAPWARLTDRRRAYAGVGRGAAGLRGLYFIVVLLPA